MIIFVLLLPLVAPNSFIWNHINNSLNETIAVCDNFYDNVCSNVAHNKHEQYIYHRIDLLRKAIEGHLSVESSKFAKVAKPVYYPDINDYYSKLFESCDSSYRSKGFMKVSRFVLDEFKRLTGTPARKSTNCKKQVANTLNWARSYLQVLKNANIGSFEPQIKAVAFAEYAREVSFEKATERMKGLFESIRKYLINTIRTSNHFNTSGITSDIVNKIERVKLHGLDFLDKFRIKHEKTIATLRTCLKYMPARNDMEVEMCKYYSFRKQYNLENSDDKTLLNILDLDPIAFNAMYLPYSNNIFIFPLHYELGAWDNLTQIASIGTIIAHELAHAVFTEEKTIKTCLASTMEEGCNVFYDQITNKNLKRKLTANQLFFYTYSTVWCLIFEKHGELNNGRLDPHSILPIRINAIFRNFDEFEKEFGCKKNDRMFVEKKKECHLTGPLSKRLHRPPYK